MKILFSDLLYQKGNVHVDTKVIELLAKKNKVFVLASSEFSEHKVRGENITIIRNRKRRNSENGIIYKLQELYRMWQTAYYARKYDVDLIYISVYEARIFPLGCLFFGRKRAVAVVENDNIDLLTNSVHRFCYKLFANRVYHLVYEDYMKNYLTDNQGVLESLVYTIPHVCYPDDEDHDTTKCGMPDYIAISASNDEEKIKKIIDYEDNFKILKKAKVNLVIKSKLYTYDSEYLHVSNTYYDVGAYSSLFYNCKAVLIPFPSSYKYRMSGNIIDAFAHRKPVVTSNIALAVAYREKYGDIVMVVNSVEELFAELVSKRTSDCPRSSFNIFLEDHSEKAVENALDRFIEQIQRP